MAGSATPSSAEPAAAVVAVAYSAGRDSTALLYATLQWASAQRCQVLALHVHHGLSPHADAWSLHAQTQCALWSSQGLPVRLAIHRVTTQPAPGDSVEAWARGVRYAALSAMALQHGADTVLLAHHARDQAETLLLQALRGSGVAGLSSMAKRSKRLGIIWLRPWLAQPREHIEQYVAQHGLAYIDDASNGDRRFDRNRLRSEVWPALVRAFPNAQGGLGRATEWLHEAAECLHELAELDLAALSTGPALVIGRWQSLSPARRSNVLRAWIAAQTGAAAPASLTTRLMSELVGAGVATWALPTGQLRRSRGRLMWMPGIPTVAPCCKETALRIARAGHFKLPGWNGVLQARRVREGGVHLAWLAHLELRPRRGGEQFQAAVMRPARSLKKQYQAANIVQWERDGPLVYSGGQLVFVPGLGMDARAIALPGQVQMELIWHAKI
jgi:tRNA(Ile)-lysidine synthase